MKFNDNGVLFMLLSLLLLLLLWNSNWTSAV
jgi:hypothetical protein